MVSEQILVIANPTSPSLTVNTPSGPTVVAVPQNPQISVFQGGATGGLVQLSPSPAGSYANANITVDAFGRVTWASEGAGIVVPVIPNDPSAVLFVASDGSVDSDSSFFHYDKPSQTATLQNLVIDNSINMGADGNYIYFPSGSGLTLKNTGYNNLTLTGGDGANFDLSGSGGYYTNFSDGSSAYITAGGIYQLGQIQFADNSVQTTAFAGFYNDSNNVYARFGFPIGLGSGNVTIGNNSGSNIRSGSYNIFLGYNCGNTVTNESSNIIIGGSADISTSGIHNSVAIGQGVVVQSSSSCVIGGGHISNSYRLNVGINVGSPSAVLHLTAGQSTAGLAPLKFSNGSLLTTAEAGAIEVYVDKIYYTLNASGTRQEFTLNDSGLTSGRIPFATTNGRLMDNTNLQFNNGSNTLTVANIAGGYTVVIPSASTVGVKIKGAASQTGDLEQWLNSNNTVLTSINSAGQFGVFAGFADAVNIAVGTTTGTKIGTSASQKLGFFNATAIVQPSSTTDLRTAIINLGLLASGGATPLNLNGGSFTAGSVTDSGLSSTQLVFAGTGGLLSGTPCITWGGASLQVTAVSASKVPLIVQGVASQTGDLQEWQNSSGTVLASINSAGALSCQGVIKRVTSVTSSSTPTPNANTDDSYHLTALSTSATFAAVGGTATNGQVLLIIIKDNGVARTLSWNSVYTPGGVALPTTTVAGKIMTLGFRYNTANSLNKWCLIALAQET